MALEFDDEQYAECITDAKHFWSYLKNLRRCKIDS